MIFHPGVSWQHAATRKFYLIAGCHWIIPRPLLGLQETHCWHPAIPLKFIFGKPPLGVLPKVWHMSAMVGIGGNGWQYPKIPSQPASDLLPKLTCAYVPNSHLSSKDRRTLYATTITISIDEKLSCCQQSSTDPSGSFPRPLLGLKAFHCPTADRLIPKTQCCQQRRESEATVGKIPSQPASDLLPKLTCAQIPNSHLSSKDRRTLYATTNYLT